MSFTQNNARQSLWPMRCALAAFFLTLCLIAVGAFVRVSGSGMGCPDWPKCFGLLIPPTSKEQLPLAYQHIEFNVFHTWTEYLNRLLGMLVGIAGLISAIVTTITYKTRSRLWVLPWLSLLGILWAAWLGKIVVDHELAPWKVTQHLLVAWFVLGVQISTVACLHKINRSYVPSQHIADFEEKTARQRLGFSLWLVLILLVVQCILGTQVRGFIDDAQAAAITEATQWFARARYWDTIHRTLSLLVFTAAITTWAFSLQSHRSAKEIRVGAFILALCTLLQMLLGIILTSWELPGAARVGHLWIASIMLVSTVWSMWFTSTKS